MTDTSDLSATVPSSAQAVANTWELVASTVHHLPNKHVVCSRRVSKLWKDAIDRNHDIKRKLFVKADGDTVAPVAFATVGQKADAPIYDDSVVKLNPIFDWVEPFDQDWMSEDGLETVAHPVGEDDSADGPFHPSEQFITQPPCLTVTIRFCWKWPNGKHDVMVPAYVLNPKGVTFGDVCDAANRALDTIAPVDDSEDADDNDVLQANTDTTSISHQQSEDSAGAAEVDNNSTRKSSLADTGGGTDTTPRFWTEMVITTAMDWWLEEVLPSDEPAEYDSDDPGDDPNMSPQTRKEIREGCKEYQREEKGIRLPHE